MLLAHTNPLFSLLVPPCTRASAAAGLARPCRCILDSGAHKRGTVVNTLARASQLFSDSCCGNSDRCLVVLCVLGHVAAVATMHTLNVADVGLHLRRDPSCTNVRCLLQWPIYASMALSLPLCHLLYTLC